jgi:hypothetical protein
VPIQVAVIKLVRIVKRVVPTQELFYNLQRSLLPLVLLIVEPRVILLLPLLQQRVLCVVLALMPFSVEGTTLGL